MERNKSLDILKGIGILFVIIGHIQEYIPRNFLIYLYSFHMPLFFYISGYLYKEQYEELNSKEYIKKRAKQLIYPYITLGLVNLLWIIIKDHNLIEIKKFILSFLYSNYIFEINYVGAIWFLLCLFNVEVIYYLIRKSKVNKYTSIVIIILFIIGIIYTKIAIYRLPFWLDITLFALLFYHLGYIIKFKRKSVYTMGMKLIFLGISICISIIGIVLNYQYCYNEKFLGRIDMLYLHFGNYIFFIITAISGIFTWQIISEIIKENFILEWLGRNTLVIMGIHIIILQVLRYIIKLAHITNFIIIFFLLFTLTLIISFISVNIINKMLPWLTQYNEFRKMIERKKLNERN